MAKSIKYTMLCWICFTTLLAGCNNPESQNAKSDNMHNIPVITEEIQKGLYTIKDSRIFFAHKSVGDNMLEGLKTLANKAQVDLIIEKIDSNQIPNSSAFAHSLGGANTDPKSKIDAFAIEIKNLNKFEPQVAFMKFCYIDFNADTNVKELFDYYRITMETLERENPGISFAHLTVPLTSRPSGIKSKIKEFIGKNMWNDDTTNVKRGEFNDLVVKTFPSEKVFDIAKIQSTYTDGSRESFKRNDKTYYRMLSIYTSDGGHLNSLGQQVVASEMISFLANTLSNN